MWISPEKNTEATALVERIFFDGVIFMPQRGTALTLRGIDESRAIPMENGSIGLSFLSCSSQTRFHTACFVELEDAFLHALVHETEDGVQFLFRGGFVFLRDRFVERADRCSDF